MRKVVVPYLHSSMKRNTMKLARRILLCSMIIAGTFALMLNSAQAVTNYLHMFGPAVGPTFSQKNTWITQSISLNPGQTTPTPQLMHVGQTVGYEWNAIGCMWEPPFVCGVGPCGPELHCLHPTTGMQVKICFGFPGNTEAGGCHDVSNTKSGMISIGNFGYTSPPLVSFKFKLPLNSPLAQVRGVPSGWSNSATIYGIR